jgi:hypothetical protein
MADQDNEPQVAGGNIPDRDDLDREIDAALAKFAFVEPRVGLEQRILANLRAEREHATEHSWWYWPALGATGALVITLSLVWRSERPMPDTAQRPTTTVRSEKKAGTRIVANNAGSQAHSAVPTSLNRPTRHGVRRPQGIVALGPRLAQFPSSRPLSEEEKLLVCFVQEFPKEAAMIARAQAESEREMEQLSGDQPPGSNSEGQQER